MNNNRDKYSREVRRCERCKEWHNGVTEVKERVKIKIRGKTRSYIKLFHLCRECREN